jgi:VanZ family protein
MLIAFGVGTFSELMQTQTLDRHPSLIDFAANGVGAAVFAWLLMRWRRGEVGRPASRRTPAN